MIEIHFGYGYGKHFLVPLDASRLLRELGAAFGAEHKRGGQTIVTINESTQAYGELDRIEQLGEWSEEAAEILTRARTQIQREGIFVCSAWY